MFTFILCIIFTATAHAAMGATLPLYPYGPMFGGKFIDIREVPYLVTIWEIYAGALPKTICSGLLISQKHVLTTAHCLVNGDWSHLYVHVNSSTRNNDVETKYRFQDFKIHEHFSVSEHGIPIHDIALVKLFDNSNRFELDPITNHAFASAVLFNETEDVSAGIDAFTTAWAKINRSEDEHLTARIVQTLDTNLCDKAYENLGGVPAGQICAAYPGAKGKDGCQGDSGAPLIIEDRVAGILSWGNGCIKSHYPGLYTKVAYYRDWIDKTMKYL